ncbi:hypothetical protein BDY19DRAFT_905168 [Irpex rosettiformis]|uniref:Uncharacterized protein n=1 Tax=Irpex rosettiformis TaxID=378272 RepID=A0ACB8U6U8_9APHY|nr:hypothetical protein BDY19DRAFT_905168 [Irpex rosettiformis]
MPAYRTRDARTSGHSPTVLSSPPPATLQVVTTTEEPLTPTVAIFSPTPRAFTFPQNDIPYASPSCSPFEPDLKPVSSTPPPPRAFSPSSSIGSETSSSVLSTPSTATSSQVSHRRRRSTISENERRPKKGDEDYIKRPENAFILFRRKCCEERNAALEESSTDEPVAGPVKKQRQADLSKTISHQWKSLSVDERTYWEDLAKEKKKEHEQMYPNYVYRPQRVKKGKKGKGRRDGEQETDDGISFIMPVPSPPRSLSREPAHSSRRAVSAPTPPAAFQTIQLPTVFMPSCPPSPGGVPRISRRTPYIPPPTDNDPSTRFEYIPKDSVLPPTFQRPNFDASSFTFQFGNQSSFQGRSANNVQLSQLTIPREPAFNNMVSPVESIASSIFSPTESIASSLSPSSSSSHCGPFTPADSMSLQGLSMGSHAGQPAPDCVPENVDGELSGELGYHGYSSWSSESLWPTEQEAILPDDFDLSSIPPIELGLTMPDQSSEGCDFERRQFGSMSESSFSDATPSAGQDPFASLFSYEGLNWT